MDTKNIKRAVRFLDRDLGEIMDDLENRGNHNFEDDERVTCLLSGIAKGVTTIAMEEAGYSERGYSYADGEPMIDYRRNDGQNYSGRNDYRGEGGRREYRNNYRRGDGEKEKMIARLRERARNERDDRRRETIEEVIRDVENEM